MSRKTVGIGATKNSDAGRYAPCPADQRMAEMDAASGPIRLAVSSKLEEIAPSSQGVDRWAVSVSRVGEDGKPFGAARTFGYTMGIGHRVAVRGLEALGGRADAPSEPTARMVFSSLGADADTAVNMPMDDEEALSYIQGEFGVQDAGEALRLMRAFRKGADKLTAILGGAASLTEFSEWARELEAVPEPVADTPASFSFDLPVADSDGGQARGRISVEIRKAQRVQPELTIDGEPMPPDALEFSVTASLSERTGRSGRWRAASSGQSVDEIRRTWSGYPLVAEFCGIWDRWHLNGMKAGSRKQIEALADVPASAGHAECSKMLSDAGLLVDPSVQVRGKPYRYGSAWLHEVVPGEVLERARLLAKEIPVSEPTAVHAPPGLGG